VLARPEGLAAAQQVTESPAPERRVGPLARTGFMTLLVMVTLLPIARIWHIVTSVGTNVLAGNDVFLTGYIPVYDRILSGRYNWLHFFRDTFIVGTHSVQIPFLIRLAIVRFSGWNVYWEDAASILIGCCTLVVIHSVLSFRVREGFRYSLWPALSLLIFSTTQLTLYYWGDAGLTFGSVQLGLAIALWSVTMKTVHPRASRVASIAGPMIASWSAANGLMVWPMLLLGVFVIGERRIRWYLTTGVFTLISAAPYAAFFDQSKAPNGVESGAHLVNPAIWLQAIGLPLAQGGHTGMAISVGLVAVVLMVCLIREARILRSHVAVSKLVPGLMLIGFGLINVIMISSSRTSLGAWYSTPFMNVWIGIVAIAVQLYGQTSDRGDDGGVLRRRNRRALLIIVGPVAIAYCLSNVTWRDKQAIMVTRAPAAASCLREYRTAPAQCRRLVYVSEKVRGRDFHGKDIYADEAAALERHHLSVFGRHQLLIMQGDAALDRTWRTSVRSEPVTWIRGTDAGRIDSWKSFDRLSVLVKHDEQMNWAAVALHPLRSSRFRTRLTLPDGMLSHGTVVTIRVCRQLVCSSGTTLWVGRWTLRNGRRSIAVDHQLGALPAGEFYIAFGVANDAAVAVEFPRIETVLQ